MIDTFIYIYVCDIQNGQLCSKKKEDLFNYIFVCVCDFDLGPPSRYGVRHSLNVNPAPPWPKPYRQGVFNGTDRDEP